MSSDLAGALAPIVPHCNLAREPEINGWSIDVWDLTPSAVDALVESYLALIIPESTQDVASILERDGVDLEALLRDEDEARDTVTRSDMTELAAAASILVRDGSPIEGMWLPNVPKGERSSSHPGIDVMVAHVNLSANTLELGPDEHVTVCSVKHTVADAADVRRKLVKSLAPSELSVTYLCAQLRLLIGRLDERGYRCPRLYLVLAPEHRERHLQLVAVAAVDAPLRQDLETQLENLPTPTGALHHFQRLVIPGLNDLHARVS
jgi:hypothetical protein